jgi:translation elongation factor EF-G
MASRVSTDHESGQTILKGTSESHLEGKIDTLSAQFQFSASKAALDRIFQALANGR